MATLEKLAKSARGGTRADMMKQIKDLDLEAEKPAPKEKDPKPGSKAYLDRRDKEGKRDLENAPRRPRN